MFNRDCTYTVAYRRHGQTEWLSDCPVPMTLREAERHADMLERLPSVAAVDVFHFDPAEFLQGSL
jgi:hypothetical protein